MRYASVCSGVGTCAMAWRPLGWVSAWFSEIAAPPAAILAYRFPEVPNRGDMLVVLERALHAQAHAEAIGAGGFAELDDFDIDLLAGGTPCQAFSIAGKRRSLEDARGNLSLAFCELAHAIDAVRSARGHAGGLPFVVWENVPGVLSTRDNAFGCFLGGLVGADQPVLPDGGWKRAGLVVGPRRSAAYRVLDAQYFGLAQRRERVAVVSCSRASGYDPAALLLEWEGVRRDSAPSRGAGEDVAGTLAGGARERGGVSTDDIPLCAEVGPTLSACGAGMARGSLQANELDFLVAHQRRVRRFMPLECERLQGYPDGHTAVPRGAAGKVMHDGPRYKAIGNGWARPVFAWVGQRIDAAVRP